MRARLVLPTRMGPSMAIKRGGSNCGRFATGHLRRENPGGDSGFPLQPDHLARVAGIADQFQDCPLKDRVAKPGRELAQRNQHEPPFAQTFMRDGQHRRANDDILVKRSEEHTSELQSLAYLVCRLLLEKKKYNDNA